MGTSMHKRICLAMLLSFVGAARAFADDRTVITR
jgi:hypothetical protein